MKHEPSKKDIAKYKMLKLLGKKRKLKKDEQIGGASEHESINGKYNYYYNYCNSFDISYSVY